MGMKAFAVLWLTIVLAEKGTSEWSQAGKLGATLAGIAAAGGVAAGGYKLYRGVSSGLLHTKLTNTGAKDTQDKKVVNLPDKNGRGPSHDDDGEDVEGVPERPAKRVVEADKAEDEKPDHDDDGKEGKTRGSKVSWIVVVVVILAIGFLVTRQSS